MTTTAEQLHILQHALGLAQNDARPAYRRHYVCAPGHHGYDDCEALTAAGLMVKRDSSALTGGDNCFLVTERGEQVARDAWERAKPKLTRSQRRYREWLDADCGATFGEWLKGWR